MKYFSTLEDIYDYGILYGEKAGKVAFSVDFEPPHPVASKVKSATVKDICGTENKPLLREKDVPDEEASVVKCEPSTLWLKVFNKHKSMLKGYLFNIVRSDHEADDLLQDTFLRVWKLNQTKEIDSPRAFIFRTAHNLALDSLRRKKVRKNHDSYDENHENIKDMQPSSERTIEAKQELGLLLEAVKQLSPKCRQVFLYRKMHGLSHREISDKMGISVRTVENHMANGMRDCRQYMKQNDTSSD